VATYTDPTTIVSTGKVDPVQSGALIVMVGGILAALVAGFFFLEIVLTNRQVTSTNNEIATKQQQLTKLQPTADQLSAIATESKDLHTVFDTQKRWVSVLDTFAQRLHKSMAVTSLQMSDKGTVVLAGIVPDYTTYAKVFQAFTDADGQKYFSVVKPTVVTKVNDVKGASYISFTFNLALQPFVLNAGSAQAVVPPQ
jgi:hypothetical protein